MIRSLFTTRIDPFITRFLSVALIVALAAVVLGTLAPTRSPYMKSDLIAYKIATDVAVGGGNPYNPETVLAKWPLRTVEMRQPPLMVWNPPAFFLFPGTILRLPESALYILWPIIPCFSGALLGLIGWQLAKGSKGSILPLSLSTFCSIPLVIEFQISQMSSFLALAPLLGILLFLSRRDLCAGLLFSVAILKPHVVFLPLAAIAFWVLWERRWRVVAGGVGGILLGSIAAELVYPGINIKWLYRPSWPVNYLGSTLPSMLRAAAHDFGYRDPGFLMILIPALGVLGLWIYLARRAPHPAVGPIIWTLTLNQFFTPYGFLMDQTVLIVVQAFMISKISSRAASRRLLLALIFAHLTVPLILTITTGPLQRLWWVSYPVALTAILATVTMRARPN
jgi:hypothetical protein